MKIIIKILNLKGQCHEIFCFRFFSWITFPQAPDNNIRFISIFFDNSRRYSQVKVHHRCQRHRWQICHRRCQLHRWQIAAGINDTGGKFAPVSKTPAANFAISSPRVVCTCQKKQSVFHLSEPSAALTKLLGVELWISPRIFEKIGNGLNGILWGWGETDSWKEPEAKNLVTLSL